MHAINALIKRFPEMLLSFPVWKFVPPRWSPLFRDIEDNFNIVIDFVKSRTDEAVQRVKEKGINFKISRLVSVLRPYFRVTLRLNYSRRKCLGTGKAHPQKRRTVSHNLCYGHGYDACWDRHDW